MTEVNSHDAYAPADIAKRVETAGVKKATQDLVTTFGLAVLAGSFIAMGAAFATTVATGAAGEIPFGLSKLLGGLVFCLGLILVVVAGAELFTGNNLIVMAWSSRLITTRQLVTNWIIVYAGNFAGAVLTAALFFLAGHANSGNGAVGDQALAIASAKCELAPAQAIAAGVGCNVLVCLAVWLCMGARSVTDKIVAIIFPITAFVTMGLEHCVANMYFIPIGMMVRESRGISDHAAINVSNFLVGNLLPVTVGNLIGGAVMVGLVYWGIYLRNQRSA
ncbi:MAG: formate/nitrite transporter family protein [Planctomycetales bacterium]|nr:formate/nitrite transporter family protein [Planctomycetales bacterium]